MKARSLLTDAQLITLAGKLGKEWTEVAMASLALDTRDIDDIQEKKDVTIYNFKVLKKWQEKEQGNATAQNLYNCLKNVPVEVQDMLKGEQEVVLIRPFLGIKLCLREWQLSGVECIAWLFISVVQRSTQMWQEACGLPLSKCRGFVRGVAKSSNPSSGAGQLSPKGQPPCAGRQMAPNPPGC